MKNLAYILIGILIVVTSLSFTVLNNDLEIKDNYVIAFKSKDPTGVFKKMDGTIQFDENDLAGSSFDLTFEVASISTGNSLKDKKALTSEWFDAFKYPNIKYKSSSIKKSGDKYVVSGVLTIRGISHKKDVPLNVSKKGNEYVFTGVFGVNRLEYKVGKKSDVVPDVMRIEYSIPVIKK